MYGIDDLKNSQKLEVTPRSSEEDDDDVVAAVTGAPSTNIRTPPVDVVTVIAVIVSFVDEVVDEDDAIDDIPDDVDGTDAEVGSLNDDIFNSDKSNT